MAELVITRLDGQLRDGVRLATMTSGLVANGVVTANYPTLGTVVELNETKDAENLGIDADYDSANGIFVHRHISEFFRLNPDAKLYLALVDQTKKPSTSSYVGIVTSMLNQANGDIRQIGIVWNPDQGTYTPTTTNGIEDEVEDAIAAYQTLYGEQVKIARPCHFIIEGKYFVGTSVVNTCLDLKTAAAGQVTVVIGNDFAIADDTGLNYADVGTFLGIVSRSISENAGYRAINGVTDEVLEKFLEGGIAAQKVSEFTETQLDTLSDKGYVFLKRTIGIDGYFWNDSWTCADANSDFYSVEHNLIWNEASRIARTALAPIINGKLATSAPNVLSVNAAREIEGVVESALDVLVRENHCQSVRAVVNRNLQVISERRKKIILKVGITPYEYARMIEAEIGLEL